MPFIVVLTPHLWYPTHASSSTIATDLSRAYPPPFMQHPKALTPPSSLLISAAPTLLHSRSTQKPISSIIRCDLTNHTPPVCCMCPFKSSFHHLPFVNYALHHLLYVLAWFQNSHIWIDSVTSPSHLEDLRATMTRKNRKWIVNASMRNRKPSPQWGYSHRKLIKGTREILTLL